MKVTNENYLEAFQEALHLADPINEWISELPDTLQKGHDFVLEASEGMKDWSLYHDDTEIARVIDLYFEKLSEYISNKKSQPDKDKEHNTSKARNNYKGDKNIKDSKNKGKIVRDVRKTQDKIYTLLAQAIEDFPSFLSQIKLQERFKVVFGDRSIDVFLDKNHFIENRYGVTLHEVGDESSSIRYIVEIDLEKRVGHVLNEQGRVLYKKLQSAKLGSEKDAGQKFDKRFIVWINRALKQGLKVDPYGSPVQQTGPRAIESEKLNSSRKLVEHITEEVKFIKRYVGLHNKTKRRSSILALIKSLQRSIVQRLIRKTSPLADEIRTMQDKLVDAYNKSKGEELDITINADELSRMVAIAGGEEVYQSIKIIKRYVGLQGREADEKTLEGFLKQIDKAIKSMKVSQDDPYYREVKSIQASVKKLINGSKLKIGKSELHGLGSILNGCGCTDNSPRKERTNKGLGSITPGVMSAEQMANLRVEELNFTYPWDQLLGKPATNFSVMFHGDPGSGKTTLLLKFVEYLANNFGRVLYVSSEEHGASTLIKKINALLPIRPARLDFAANLAEPDLSQYDFIVLDSVNNLKLKLDDFKNLKKDYPQTSFIVVLQHTKDGNYRGGKDWEHEIEMAVKVEHGLATTYRTRYGVYGTLDFFTHFNITPDMFK